MQPFDSYRLGIPDSSSSYHPGKARFDKRRGARTVPADPWSRPRAGSAVLSGCSADPRRSQNRVGSSVRKRTLLPTLRVVSATAAGVTDRLREIGDAVALVEAADAKLAKDDPEKNSEFDFERPTTKGGARLTTIGDLCLLTSKRCPDVRAQMARSGGSVMACAFEVTARSVRQHAIGRMGLRRHRRPVSASG